jgi:glycerol uptake facilitator protein
LLKEGERHDKEYPDLFPSTEVTVQKSKIFKYQLNDKTIMTEYFAEFLGTFILISFGDGVVAGAVLNKTKSQNMGWLNITLAWGLAVAFAIYAVGHISGAHINPAVTLAMASAGTFPWEKVTGYILAQIAGAFTGAVLVWAFYYNHWKASSDAQAKLSIFCTTPAIRSYKNNLVSEIIGTFFLTFGLFFIGINKFSEGLNPLVVGALISLIGFSFGGTTGFAINPARDLGPRIAHALLPIAGKGISDWSYSWIPVVGPLIGGVLGALTYQAVYEGIYSAPLWIFAVLTLGIIIYSVLRRSVTPTE